MTVVHIHRTLDSETLHLPEVRPLIGKNVEIIIIEETKQAFTPGTGNWESARNAAEELRSSGYDFDAWRLQREYDVLHVKDHPFP